MKSKLDIRKVLAAYEELKKKVKGREEIIRFLSWNFKVPESEIRAIIPEETRKVKKPVLTPKEPEKTNSAQVPCDYRALVNYVWGVYRSRKAVYGDSVWEAIDEKHYPFAKREGEELRLWNLALKNCQQLEKTLNDDSLRDAPRYKVRALV